ncbi:PREDICTED: uncharacterized protein LOC104803499 isoform X2 [Tarenaya hassleriana]|uniref:uncharacterized protein LOC104803499 isoform X2 n=1 Tax=Tarenaya hassleriana TaxID=28532 RepID=UPI00053C640C|nr:PREDICTED: uncharacterized protein LOC104803499 isoform X2 [Tarenaya hassleriana]
MAETCHPEIEVGSSNNMMYTSDVCSISLELSENDPFYQQKKKLLHCQGFGVKETLQLNSSLSAESFNIRFEKLLRFARITNLDEVELYFGEDACNSAGIYSVRNEISAHNSILSLIDFSSKTQTEVDCLKALQGVVIGRINEFGAKNEEAFVDKSYRCEKENVLVQWGQSNGVRTKLQIAQIEGFGRGAIASEDLNVGDVALEIPVANIISEEYVFTSYMYPILEKIDGMTSETMLLLWTMREKQNPDSKFKAYFDSLPDKFCTGLSFGVDAIMELDGTLLLDEIMQAKELLREKYEELSPVLSNHPDIFPPELYTWEHYLWACELFYSNSMQIKFPDGKLKTCLIPIAGFLNHSVYPHIVKYGIIDGTTSSLKFPLSRPCRKGEQCYLSYGNYSSSHLITFYGFLPAGDNPYDVIPLDIDVSEIVQDEENAESSWTNHMLRGTWLSNNHGIFHYGLPTPLLNYFRSAHGIVHRSETDLLQNLEVEMEVLENLRSTFEDMMQNLGDADSMDRENVSRGVKLAVEFKDHQRKIVSSILDSCSKGQKLIQEAMSEQQV